MKQRTGTECKKVDCVRHKVYIKWFSNLGNKVYIKWFSNLGNRELGYCMSCKYAHASQYVKGDK
jgi:hypothetical protein